MTIAATILHNIGACLKFTGINHQRGDSFITIDFSEISDAVGLGIASFVVDDKTNNVFFIVENPFETIEFDEELEFKVKEFCHKWLWKNENCAAFPVYDDEFGLHLIFKYPCATFYNNSNFEKDFSDIWRTQSQGVADFFKLARKEFRWDPYLPENIVSDFMQIRLPEF